MKVIYLSISILFSFVPFTPLHLSGSFSYTLLRKSFLNTQSEQQCIKGVQMSPTLYLSSRNIDPNKYKW